MPYGLSPSKQPAMASVHLTGPRVAVAAKPAALGGLRLPTPSITVPSGRRARGLVVRAATVVSPKVTNNALGSYGSVCSAADPRPRVGVM